MVIILIQCFLDRCCSVTTSVIIINTASSVCRLVIVLSLIPWHREYCGWSLGPGLSSLNTSWWTWSILSAEKHEPGTHQSSSKHWSLCKNKLLKNVLFATIPRRASIPWFSEQVLLFDSRKSLSPCYIMLLLFKGIRLLVCSIFVRIIKIRYLQYKNTCNA